MGDTTRTTCDLAIVGAGPAGAAAALGALAVAPGLSVLLLDRHDFPRDKACGDGIAPQVLDLLAEVGLTGLLDDWKPVGRFTLRRHALEVDRELARANWVVPRAVFDHRLVLAARAAGARLVRHRVRSVDVRSDHVGLDGTLAAEVVVGADGAHSVVRAALGVRPNPVALALRGYAPTPEALAGRQMIVFGAARQPAYAWSFDRGDGLSNVGYGELLSPHRPRPSRAGLRAKLEELIPGSAERGTAWRAHHLPLSTWRWRPHDGRILLTGDAAALINPMTGEGIYYAVATGLLAGRAAALAIGSRCPGDAGARYRRTVGPLLSRHLRHLALASRLCRFGHVLDTGIRAATASRQIFDDLVELGLANGTISPELARAIALGSRWVGTSGPGARGQR
ncbi:geranylgeranyl reductase family protein [Actinomycetes bacterium KLBMP 9759]